MQDIDRRSVLGLVAGTGVGALAGCSMLGGGSSLSTEDWMPERDDEYNVVAADVEAALDADISSEGEDRLGQDFFTVPSEVIEVDDVGAFASAGSIGTVCTYNVEKSELVENLEDLEDGERDAPDAPDGYEAFGKRRMLYWVGDDYLIAARQGDLLEQMYDTEQGDEDAYMETDNMSALSDALDKDDIMVLTPYETGAAESGEGLAYGWSFDDETAAFKLVVMFGDESEAEDADLSSLTEMGPLSEYDDVETSADGRFGVVTGSISVDDFDLLSRENSSSSSQATVPQVAFSFEYDDGGDGEWNGNDGEQVVIQHDGGETVDVATISIRVGGTPVSEASGIESDKPSSGDMSAGDQWTLQPTSSDNAFESGTTITLVWRSPDGDTAQILFESEIP